MHRICGLNPHYEKQNLHFMRVQPGFAIYASSGCCIIRHFLTNFVALCFTNVLQNTPSHMAITVDYVVLPHLRKADGTNFIRIRVTHQRKSKYIKTNISIEPEDLTRSGNLKHQGKKDLAEDEVKSWRRIVNDIPSSSVNDMSIDFVVRYIQARLKEQGQFHLNFAEYGRRLADMKKPATRKNYIVALSCLCRFYGHEPDISEITVQQMHRFADFIRKEGNMSMAEDSRQMKCERTVVRYMFLIGAVYRAARVEFNDPDLGIMRIPVDIFEYIKIQEPKGVEHRDIPIEWIQMMIDQRKELEGAERYAVDMFLVSFGLMGINVVDMYYCEKAKAGIVHYYRTKTKDKKDDRAEMFVRIEPCIGAIIAQYEGKGRLLNMYERFARKDNANRAINYGLRQFIKRNGLEDFTSYAARHTWATLGASKAVGLDLSIVTEGLSHSNQSRRMDMVYIRKDWERVWEANAKVLAQLKW